MARDEGEGQEEKQQAHRGGGRYVRGRGRGAYRRIKTGSNLLHSQHQGDDHHKDVRSEPLDKTRLAKNTSALATPARDYYLLADPRLAEAHDFSTLVPQAETEDICVKNQEKPKNHQAKTEDTKYQAKAKGGIKNENIGTKNPKGKDIQVKRDLKADLKPGPVPGGAEEDVGSGRGVTEAQGNREGRQEAQGPRHGHIQGGLGGPGQG